MTDDARPLESDDDNSRALATVRKVHAELAPLLVESYGEELRINEAADPNSIVASYIVGDFEFDCRIGVVVGSASSAILSAATNFISKVFCGKRHPRCEKVAEL